MEQSIPRSRGRPRKRRKEDKKDGTSVSDTKGQAVERNRKRRKMDEKDGKSVPEAKRQVVERKPIALVGRYVMKKFPRNGVFLGKVVYYECGLYRVIYEDGDFEDLESGEIRPILISDAADSDVGLTKRRTKLEKLVLQNRVKAADVADTGSPKSVKEESAVDVTGPSELDGGISVEIEKDEDADDGSDDDLSSVSVSDAETAPLPPPLLLPPSSGSIGVPELSVSHLFSVYGFLRSFSIQLFLHPFTLDDFVGSLNCKFSNNLFDAIHISLMRVLRRHLETLSPEESELASQCLRCYDWNLLDTLTWPVFVVLYLLVNGFTKGPEWKGFYDEVFSGEYYMLPVSRKLVILQILCDDVLESDELKTEMSMRKESEVGLDYDAEDTIPAETGPRKVHPRYARTSFCEDKEAIKLVSTSIAVKQPGSYCRDTENTGDGDADRNGDDCRLCGMDGTLLCCDGCPSAYHSRCIGVMKMFIPEGPWYCPECKINMAGPTIAKGTSLRGAVIFGRDLYGQLFMGTCDHLLVLNIDNNEVCLRYYNQKDIPKVVQVLYESTLHRPMYYDICMAVLQYWNVAEKFLPLPASTETNIQDETQYPASTETNIKDETQFPAPLLPPPSEDNLKPVSLVQGENSPTTASLIHNGNMVSSLDALEVITHSPALDSSGIVRSEEGLTMNKNLGEETRMEAIISAGSVSHQSNLNFQNSVNMSTAVDATKRSLINSQLSNCVHANDMGLPLNFSSQNKESGQLGFGKCEYNANDDFCYMGFLYKPMSYINYYMHGDFSASAASKFAIVSSEESRLEVLASDSQKKTAAAYTYMQAKAFSLAASRFFWPSSEKKLVEVPRERCGWCISCKAPVASKKGCMLNHALISATKSAVKILATFSPIRSGEGILPSTIATYLLYMENCLHGLVVGPFSNASFRKNWRKQMEHATTFTAIKSLLLKLEENIRIVAFCGDWVKLMDDWLVEFPIIQSATSTLGTTQKRAPSGKRYKKKSSIDESTDNVIKESMWWRGGKVTKYIFQSAALPKSMVRKAARQGGSRKVSGIVYADGSEIPKRSRQLVWRAAVQMSRNGSQLALQVRCLDSYLRWSDLIRPEQNIQEGKGQEAEASAFRNANICDKKLVEGKVCYGIAFGSQKHLPNRVMKSVVEKEQCPLGKEKYWFSETRIPLYLVKEYEEGNEMVPCEEQYSSASQLHRRKLKGTCKGCNDIFFYLVCKRDNLVFWCSSCRMGISIRNAHKCNACQGYCHEDCSVSSVLRLSTNGTVECLTTCKRCHHSKLLAPNVTSNESPTSPLILQRQVTSTGTGIIFKGPRPKAGHSDVKQVNSMSGLKGSKRKSQDQTSTSTKKKNSHPDTKQAVADSTLASSNRRNNNCSWGIIWKKRSNEDTNIDFRTKNILLKGGSDIPNLSPVCHLCKNDYRSDLMYICCETCQNWYHAEAVELEESKISNVLGFKCCKCRRIKSPICPYDANPKSEVKKSRRKASKKQHSGPDSDSGAFNDMRESEPATPVFPVENDPLLFSLANVELITEPNQLDSDVEWNTLSMPGPQKLPVRRHVKHEGGSDGSVSGIPFHDELSTYRNHAERHVKHEGGGDGSVSEIPFHDEFSTYRNHAERHVKHEEGGDGSVSGIPFHDEFSTYRNHTERHVKHEEGGDGSVSGIPFHDEFSTYSEAGNLSNPADSILPLEYDSAVFDSNLLSNSEFVNNDDSMFNDNTIFDVNDLLRSDDSQIGEGDVTGELLGHNMDQNNEGDVPGEFLGYNMENSGTPLPEEFGDGSFFCAKCLQTEPGPEFFCGTCGVLYHGHCLPWPESASDPLHWTCQTCRDWQ